LNVRTPKTFGEAITVAMKSFFKPIGVTKSC
jgi:hypothetical protein